MENRKISHTLEFTSESKIQVVVWYLCSYWWITMHDFTSLTKMLTTKTWWPTCKWKCSKNWKVSSKNWKAFSKQRTFIAKSSPASVNYFIKFIISHSQHSPQTTQRGILSSTNNFKQGHFSPAIKNTSTVTPLKVGSVSLCLIVTRHFFMG